MAFLLISGLGPFRSHSEHLAGTLLARDFATNQELRDTYARLLGQPIDPRRLTYTHDGHIHPLLRAQTRREPCLSTMTLQSILEVNGVDFDSIDVEDLWYEGAEAPRTHYDVVGISSTYLCRRRHLRDVIRWAHQRFPDATLIVGGQYSNLKYATILREHPEVEYIIRGDAEVALPKLLSALASDGDVSQVPNLVMRAYDGSPLMTPHEYIDVEATPSPSFRGEHPTVPYESMRGCPFTCKYCSFPAASPKWRFKSVEKIVGDWRRYKDENGATLVASLDSTFTIPPARLRRLMEVLPDLGMPWYGFSRANTINSREIVRQLEDSHCIGLAIGFESMNDSTLLAMDKKVTAAENRRAFELLADSELAFNGGFIIGYPGETLETWETTRQFIVKELRGRFALTVFNIIDETMPVWAEAEKYGLEETDEGWRHNGMDQATAGRLLGETVREVRWSNDDAVMITWQVDFAIPLVPGTGAKGNRRIEKLIERLSFLPRDLGTGEDAARRGRALVAELETLGIRQAPEQDMAVA